MTDYEDVTERYTQYPRIDLAALPRGNDMMIGDLIRTSDGRILVPELGPEEANLFAIYARVGGEQMLLAEFSTLGEAEEFLDLAEEQGFQPLRWGGFLSPEEWNKHPELRALFNPWIRTYLVDGEK